MKSFTYVFLNLWTQYFLICYHFDCYIDYYIDCYIDYYIDCYINCYIFTNLLFCNLETVYLLQFKFWILKMYLDNCTIYNDIKMNILLQILIISDLLIIIASWRIEKLKFMLQLMFILKKSFKYMLKLQVILLSVFFNNMLINIVINLAVIHARWVTIQAKNMQIIRCMWEIMTDEC